MPPQQTTEKPEREIDRMLRQLGEDLQPVIAAFYRDYVPVSARTAIRRARAERRMRAAEAVFRAELTEGASPMPKGLDPSDIQRIRKLYAEGVGTGEVARQAHVCEKTVRAHTRDLPRHRPAYPPLSVEAVATLYTLFDEGKTLTEAATEVGISVTTAHRYRKRREAT